MAQSDPRPEPEPAAEPVLAPTASGEVGMERPGGMTFAVAAILAVGLGAMVLFQDARPPQPPPEPVLTPTLPAAQAALPAEVPIDLAQVQPADGAARVQDQENLVPYREEPAQATPAMLADARAPTAKPRLKLLPDIQPVAQRAEQGPFKTLHLIPNPAVTQAGLPQCTRCGNGAAAYRRDPIIAASGGEDIGTARFIGMCGGAYAYEITNRSDYGYRATFTDRSGEAWDVDLPPGGSTVIKSGNPLTGGLTGRQR